jgi:chromosome segregation ATPase
LHSSPSQRANGDQRLRHVLDGRVERRLRRAALRTALDKLDAKHQRSSDHARSQINQLRAELRARDREIYELQNATIVVDTDRVWDLEQQVDGLQRELQDAQDRHQREATTFVDWTMAARDPFEDREYTEMDHRYDGEDEDDDMFGDATVAQFACSTPSRARASFPTPPATSPLMLPGLRTPSSPSHRYTTDMLPTPASVPMHAGVQACLPDPEQQVRQAEFESLQRETKKLTATLESYKQLMSRLNRCLPELPSAEDDGGQAPSSTEEAVERQVESLLQSLSGRTSTLTALKSSISSLGFPGKDESEMLTSLSAAFRTARLELEYLTPGEITLPLTSHGAEVLDLVLAQLRDLARRVKEGDDAVDEYHAIELNLRQQLDARVSAMDDLRADLTKAEIIQGDKDARIRELEVANDRLKGAVEGYVRDMAELERLVERMEKEASDKDATLAERQGTITGLETQLAEATARASELKDELEVAQACRKKHLAAVNRRSGEALALRDARVAELRGEIDRVNGSLREAHERIRKLRVDHGSIEDENRSLRAAVEGMKGELQRVMRMSEELLEGRTQDSAADTLGVENSGGQGGVVSGGLLSGTLARRSSGGKRKRRRYDSGLGFLDEDEVDV